MAKSRRQCLKMLTVLPWLVMGCHPEPTGFQHTDLSGNTWDVELDLPDLAGRPRRLADFRGKVVLVIFGYTSCPDLCPTALAKYAALLEQPNLGPDRIQLLFVSLDPARDTPPLLRDYLAWFHPNILGLRGSPEQTQAIVKRYRVTAIRQELPGGTGYSIDHSVGAYALDRQGKLRLFFPENASPKSIEADLQQLLERR